jgi:hypothetical protein
MDIPLRENYMSSYIIEIDVKVIHTRTCIALLSLALSELNPFMLIALRRIFLSYHHAGSGSIIAVCFHHLVPHGHAAHTPSFVFHYAGCYPFWRFEFFVQVYPINSTHAIVFSMSVSDIEMLHFLFYTLSRLNIFQQL